MSRRVTILTDLQCEQTKDLLVDIAGSLFMDPLEQVHRQV